MMPRAAAFLSVLALVACSRSEPPPQPPRTASLPATCARAQFQEAVDQFEAIAQRRDEILGRADTYASAEPVEYRNLVARDEAEYQELAQSAEKIFTPRCLHAAREIFAGYLEKSRLALEARRPSDDPSSYRQRRETADTVYGQFTAEVAQQRRNAQ